MTNLVSRPNCDNATDLTGERVGDKILVTCGRCGNRWERNPSIVCPRCASGQVSTDATESRVWEDDGTFWRTEEVDFLCQKCHRTWHETNSIEHGDEGYTEPELMTWTVAELRTEAAELGLVVSGLRKNELIASILLDQDTRGTRRTNSCACPLQASTRSLVSMG